MNSATHALSAARRERELAELTAADPDSPVADLVVIGGGITGAGIALDAATRGLDTVLLEAHDLGFGTSRWSSKLAHGGLRYLASGQVGIAHRSAVERDVLLTHTAPHLTRPLVQVVPVYRGGGPVAAVLPRLGFVAGDVLARLAGTPTSKLPPSSTVGPRTVERLVPGVRTEGLLGGHLNWDCQLVDDARLVAAVARTAAAHGAKILTRMRVEEATGTTVTAVDTLTGTAATVRARAVVNATGVWAGTLSEELTVRPSRGTHLVVRTESVGNPTGSLTVAVPGSTSRFCFILPQAGGLAYVGLTDVDAPGPVPDVPSPDQDEIDFLLSVVNPALARPLDRSDIVGTYSGLRPLLDDGPGNTADLSREHAIRTGPDGLVTITGGKLTEYRVMAEQVVDLAGSRLERRVAPCVTRDVPLIGAPGTVDLPVGAAAGELPDPATLPHTLVLRYGEEAPLVVARSLLDRPLEPVAPGLDVVRAEFSHHVTHEGALTVDDILDRRSRIGLVAADRAAAEPAAAEALRVAGGLSANG